MLEKLKNGMLDQENVLLFFFKDERYCKIFNLMIMN